MTFSARRLGPADLASYKAVRLEALTAAPTAFGSDAASEAMFSSEVWLARLKAKSTFGVFDGSELVGIATFGAHTNIKERHRGNIYGVYVKTAARGTGAGRLLLETLIAAVPDGLLQIHLTVTGTNVAAVRFYKKLGFKIYGTEPRSLYVDGRYYDEHFMVLRLDEGSRKVTDNE